MPVRLVCVCPNPAIDHTVVVPRIAALETVRTIHSRTTPGGKGLNVARFAANFGVEVLAVTWLGEVGAGLMRSLARCNGVPITATTVPGAAVRVCPVLVSSSDRSAVCVADPAPQLGAAAWGEFVELVGRTVVSPDVVCVAGSFPRVDGIEPVGALMQSLESAESVWIDTSGEGLAAAAAFTGASLKVNLAEATGLLGSLDHGTAASERDQALAAVELLGRGCRDAVVTAGRSGAAARTSSGVRWVDSPKIATVNPVASGDAFMAGFLCAGHGALAGIRDPLRAAVLAGAANALTWAPEVPLQTVLELHRQL